MYTHEKTRFSRTRPSLKIIKNLFIERIQYL
nr:MAG TPA: hypothetical protein [Caudoviricetes sp.]